MRGRRSTVAGVLAVLLPWGSACQHEDVDPDQARATLETQRSDVRAAAKETLPSLARATGASVAFAKGEWAGCTTDELEGPYGDFRYRVGGRLEAITLDQAAGWLAGHGWQVGRPELARGRSSLGATRDGLTLGLTAYDGQPYVLVGLSGECVEVGDADREHYQSLREAEPDVLQ